jgi:hypothetical protein
MEALEENGRCDNSGACEEDVIGGGDECGIEKI